MPAPFADAAENVEAAAFIQDLANKAAEMLGDTSITLEDREARFRKLLNNGFAIKTIGKFVVGRYWRKMSPAQQDEYQKLFGEWMLKIYSSRLGGYSGQTLKIVKTIDSGKKGIYVRTLIEQPGGGKAIRADFSVRKSRNGFKIVDIGVEGISMLMTQKSEFAALLRKRGVVGLIEMLRARNSKFPAMSG
ncbi:MAG: ABC transporter substrate-binding protein [Rhodospirillales bacterium]